MRQDQTNQHSEPTLSFRSEKKLRDERLSYTGKLRLMIPFGAFALTLPTQVINISSTGILVRTSIKTLERQEGGALPVELLSEGDAYALQLDHDYPHLPAIVLDAVLVRRSITPQHWDMAFSFRVATPDLMALLHNIVRGPHEPPFSHS